MARIEELWAESSYRTELTASEMLRYREPGLERSLGEAVGPHEDAEGVAHGLPECPPGHGGEHPGRGVGPDGSPPGHGGDHPGRGGGSGAGEGGGQGSGSSGGSGGSSGQGSGSGGGGG